MKENSREIEKMTRKRQGNFNPKPPMKFRIINAETNELLHTLSPKAKRTFRRKPFHSDL